MRSKESHEAVELREAARKLLEAVPDGRVSAALSMLRRLADVPEADRPRRRFRTVGVFDADCHLGKRSKAIARQQLGGSSNTA